MPKISKEESAARRNEIIDACAALYQSKSYHDITMTQVAENVSFGRANVYRYFPCKDEILLAFLQREHEAWACELESLAQSATDTPLDDELIANGLAASLESREQMLKLLAMNLFDMEQNSRFESLVEFKRAYEKTVRALRGVLAAGKPHWDEARTDRFVFAFMPFLHGAYPYAFHSEKQLEAMREVGLVEAHNTIRSLVHDCARKLLQEDE